MVVKVSLHMPRVVTLPWVTWGCSRAPRLRGVLCGQSRGVPALHLPRDERLCLVQHRFLYLSNRTLLPACGVVQSEYKGMCKVLSNVQGSVVMISVTVTVTLCLQGHLPVVLYKRKNLPAHPTI